MSTQLPLKANVSELRLCRRCPRLFAFELSGEKNAWQVGVEGVSYCGKVFHNKIAARFHRDATGRKGAKKRRSILELFQKNAHDHEALKKAFLNRVYRNYLAPFLAENSQTYSASQVELFGKCIVMWGDFLVDFFCSNPGFRDNPQAFTEQAFLPPERNLNSNYTANDGTILNIGGRFDCALMDRTANEVQLVEFKCLMEANTTEKLAQLALYAWMVRENMGLSSRSSVLYLEEEKPLASFSAKETEKVVSLLPHLFGNVIRVIQVFHSGDGTIPKTDNSKLCSGCSYQKECDSRFGK